MSQTPCLQPHLALPDTETWPWFMLLTPPLLGNPAWSLLALGCCPKGHFFEFLATLHTVY